MLTVEDRDSLAKVISDYMKLHRLAPPPPAPRFGLYKLPKGVGWVRPDTVVGIDVDAYGVRPTLRVRLADGFHALVRCDSAEEAENLGDEIAATVNLAITGVVTDDKRG